MNRSLKSLCIAGVATVSMLGIATSASAGEEQSPCYPLAAEDCPPGPTTIALTTTTTDAGSGVVPPSIPETGSDVGGIVQIGGITLLVGAGLAFAAASRRRRPVAD